MKIERFELFNEEAHPEKEIERKKTNFRRGDFDPYDREKDVLSIFGDYADDIPPQVIQYMRKNPDLIIKRLIKIYGPDRFLKFINK